MSKKARKGSKLVLLAGVNRNKNRQINYGTGKHVIDETIEDSGELRDIK